MVSMWRTTELATLTVVSQHEIMISDGANSSSASTVLPHFIPFQTGPSLERIPDDILYELISYLPTLPIHHVLFGVGHPSRIPSDSLIRMPTLRALSRTSRLLRSRCLAVAWKNIELWGDNPRVRGLEAHMAIRKIVMAYMRTLKECPYLLPLIKFVTALVNERQLILDCRLGPYQFVSRLSSSRNL